MEVLEMAAYAEESLKASVKALLERNADLAQDVVDKDNVINRLECEIDDHSLKLLALAQPVAKDLRFIVGAMRMIVNLERIGDEAVNIAERTMILSNRPPLPFNHLLEELSSVCLEMYRTSIKAFRDGDAILAQKVCRMDTRADDLDVSVIKQLIGYMLSETPAIERSVHTILISRSMERICDLCTNLAECVIFNVEGVNVKHHCGRI